MEAISQLNLSLHSVSRLCQTDKNLTRMLSWGTWTNVCGTSFKKFSLSSALVYHLSFPWNLFSYPLFFIWKPEVLKYLCQSLKIEPVVCTWGTQRQSVLYLRGWHWFMLYIRNSAFFFVVFGVFNIVCLVFEDLCCVWRAQHWSVLYWRDSPSIVLCLRDSALVSVAIKGFNIGLRCVWGA